MQCDENSNRWQFANMASFKYLWHLICIGYMSLFLYKAKLLLGVLGVLEISQDEISQYKQQNYQDIQVSSPHSVEHTHHMNFSGPVSPFWFPSEAHRFIDAISTKLMISLSTSILSRHKKGTIELDTDGRTDGHTHTHTLTNLNNLCSIQERTKLFSIFLRSQCNPLVFTDISFLFHSK